ncbi:MAG: TorF family putative porin [Parvularculaceae bacterium]
MSFAARTACAAAAFMLASLGGRAAAGDVAVDLTVGMESTSVFRGYRAQRLNPNPYLVLDLEWDALYAGLYAAPVAFGEEENAILMGYAGYAPSAAGLEFDFGMGVYAFPDSHVFEIDADGDGSTDHAGRKGLVEPYAGVARAAGGFVIEAFVFYTPDNLGETGPGWYASAEAEQVLGEGFALVGAYGVSRFNDDRLNDDYDDWRVSLEKSLFGFDLKLRYSDTVGAPGPDNRTLALVVERPFSLLSSAHEDDQTFEKVRNRWIIDKCRLRAGR